ncbi:MAG: hypothetical protein DMG21_01475 [Acidobacteria bacterium]|nr:MAG: hypothetical protein DMG21_01475 [Acidobacteriota bacterium]
MATMSLRVWAACSAVLFCVSVALAQVPAPKVQSEIQRGLEALRRGDYTTAEELFSGALKTSPTLAEVRANLGLAYYADHKYAEASQAFRTVLQQDPSLKSARTFLPLSLAAQGQCEEALPGLRRGFASNPDAKLRRDLGLSLERCLLQTRQQADADEVIERLLALYPDDGDVLYEAGQMYGKLSSELYLRLLKVAPHSARGFQVMGQVAATEGNWQKAVDAYRQAIQTDPNLPGVRLDLAIQLLVHSTDPGAWKEALSDLNAELQINPMSPEAHYEIGEIYRKHDQLDAAAAAFERAIRLRPDFVEARMGLAKALRQQGKSQEAVSVLETTRKTAPDDAGVHYLLAQLYRELGRPADAEREEEAFQKLQKSPQ